MDGRANINIRTLKRIVFLKDVFLLAISGFGGPQVHFVMFMRRLVHKKRYITEEDLKELNSFCSMLPGPTSTQTITSIGFRLGGPLLAFFTLAVWIMPASVLMCMLAVLLSTYGHHHINLEFLKFVQPMAVGFMVYAALRISRMFARSPLEWSLLFLAAALAILIRSPFVFPLILVFGGFVSNLQSKKRDAGRYRIKNVHWDNFILFISIFLVSAVVAALVKNFYGRDLARPFLVFENTYRYGSLVFGGGNVLIPMMFEQFVRYREYLSAQDFITGFGILQALPGPVFSFAAFAGGMSMSAWGLDGIALGALVGTVGIFLPGILLIFFLYPIWDQLKTHPHLKNAVSGINAASAGLVVASAYLLFEPIGFDLRNLLIVLGTVLVLFTGKVSPPLVVALTLLCGFIF